ncbi:hypothetical protein ACHQM5_022047 [Ranunculus cassubicifolius]
MKPTKHPRRTSENSIPQCNVDISLGSTIAETPIKTPSGRKKAVRSNTPSVYEDKESPSKGQTFSERLPVNGTCLLDKTNLLPTLEQVPKPKLKSPAKIKLQLFPIDLSTQKAMEKGGHNPYLELTLSKQKKISSVLRHLKSKWGSVYSAGDIMLFPYDIQLENIAAYMRWTSEDTDSTAGNVYESIGCPSLFRLRYGWFPNVEPKILQALLTAPWLESTTQTESIKQSRPPDSEIVQVKKKQRKIVPEKIPPPSTSHSLNIAQDRANEPMDNPRSEPGFAPTSSIWADSLTNISLGGLLSEASLQAAAPISQTDTLVAKNNTYSQQVPFTCDSFDAAIAAHIYRHSQDPHRVPSGPQSSILDAEETCHGFLFRKFGSSGKDVATLSKSPSGSSIQEVKIEPGATPTDMAQEAKEDSLRIQAIDHNSSSLGLSGIKWNDSLSQFDLGLSSRRPVTGDSNSLSGFLTNSMDAFQNFSLFGRNVAPS